MMTIGDLATIMHHNLPVKLFIFNNGGYLISNKRRRLVLIVNIWVLIMIWYFVSKF